MDAKQIKIGPEDLRYVDSLLWRFVGNGLDFDDLRGDAMEQLCRLRLEWERASTGAPWEAYRNTYMPFRLRALAGRQRRALKRRELSLEALPHEGEYNGAPVGFDDAREKERSERQMVRLVLWQAVEEDPPQERALAEALLPGVTQQEAAGRLAISQAQVSRLRKRLLGRFAALWN